MRSTLLKAAVACFAVCVVVIGWRRQQQLAADNVRLWSELASVRAQLAAMSQRAELNRVAAATPPSAARAAVVSPALGAAGPAASTPADAAPVSGGTNAVEPSVDLEARLTRIADMKNVGRASPVAAVQTILWAIEHGDGSLADMLFLNKATRQDADALMAALPDSARAQYETPEKIAALYLSKQVLDYVNTVQVQGVKQLDPETVEVSVLSGERGPTVVSMQWSPNGWLWKVKPSVIAGAKQDLLGIPPRPSP